MEKAIFSGQLPTITRFWEISGPEKLISLLKKYEKNHPLSVNILVLKTININPARFLFKIGNFSLTLGITNIIKKRRVVLYELEIKES